MSARRTLLMQPRQRAVDSPSSSASRRRAPGANEPLVQLADDSDLPPHEPLQLPLGEAATRTIAEIANRATTLRAYETHLRRSTELLREAMGSIHETHSERQAQLAEKIESREQRGRTEASELEKTLVAAVERLREPVAELSTQIERGARTTIDRQMELEDERKALEWVAAQLTARVGEDKHRRVQREMEASQRRAARAERRAHKRRRRDSGGDGGGGSGDDRKAEVEEEAEENDENDTEEEEEDDNTGPPPLSAVDALESERRSRADKYAALTAHQKYALNNDYSTFKQTWHLAVYQDNEVALPDASAWFDANGEPAAYGPNAGTGGGGGGGAGGAGGDGDHSDEDLIVERETISLLCPLSLVTMTDPCKSIVCKHVFERTAIMEFLSSGPKTCPQTGCDKILVKTQMTEDNVMRRRILRAQKAEQRRNEAADMSDMEGDGIEDVENVVVSRSQADALRAKREASQAETAARTIKRERFQRRYAPHKIHFRPPAPPQQLAPLVVLPDVCRRGNDDDDDDDDDNNSPSLTPHHPTMAQVVRVCVCGDEGTGKSSLIASLVKDVFITNKIQAVLPAITIPPNIGTPENVTTTIVDTSARPQDRTTLRKEIRKCNVILLVYADHYSYERVALFWMPYFRSLGVNVPVVLCANKSDLVNAGDTKGPGGGGVSSSSSSSGGGGGSSPGDDQQVAQVLEEEMVPVMQEFREIDSCIRTSARKHRNVNEVFFLCQKAVTHPIAPLFDYKEGNLKPACVAALRRIFYLCDKDQDGYLNDKEMHAFQETAFDRPLSEEDLASIKLTLAKSRAPHPNHNHHHGTAGATPSHAGGSRRTATGTATSPTAALHSRGTSSTLVAGSRPVSSSGLSRSPHGHGHHHINGNGNPPVVPTATADDLLEHGVDLAGFLQLNRIYAEKGRHETIWVILRKFHYTDSLSLADSFLRPRFDVPEYSSAELSPAGYRFFMDLFLLFDKDNDGGLNDTELTALFAPTPGLPASWIETGFPGSTVRNEAGHITLQGWLAQWSMTTFLEPKTTLEYLAYLGFEAAGARGPAAGPTAALKITKPRKRRRRPGRVDRNVVLCYIVGAPGAGKSTLLDAFLGRPFNSLHRPTIRPRRAVNSVELEGGKQCYLILEELGELEPAVLENQARLNACDLLCFAYDSSDPDSFGHVVDLRARNGHMLDDVPAVYAALKADRDKTTQRCEQQPDAYTAALRMSAPLHVSATWESINELFVSLAEAATTPSLAFPKSEEPPADRTSLYVTLGAVACATAAAFIIWRRSTSQM